jgi:Uma2 family endonuclease
MADEAIQARKWTRVEYDRLVECEILGSGERLELLAGDMVVKEPQHSPHATGIQLAAEALRLAFGPAFHVRVQAPVALDADSEPEPDVCVVAGAPRDYRDAHPVRPVLIAEVALSRLAFDRERKGSLYARAGIGEYWIVNLLDRRLEVYRDPAPDAAAPLGWRYGGVQSLAPGARIAPLTAPSALVPVADLLP